MIPIVLIARVVAVGDSYNDVDVARRVGRFVAHRCCSDELARREAGISDMLSGFSNKLREAQQRILDEMIDFLSLMAGGAESPEAREIIKQYKAFLAQLGTSEVELVRHVRIANQDE